MSIAVVQTKVINCNGVSKSCLLQAMHTKAIAALIQFCNFLATYRQQIRKMSGFAK